MKFFESIKTADKKIREFENKTGISSAKLGAATFALTPAYWPTFLGLAALAVAKPWFSIPAAIFALNIYNDMTESANQKSSTPSSGR